MHCDVPDPSAISDWPNLRRCLFQDHTMNSSLVLRLLMNIPTRNLIVTTHGKAMSMAFRICFASCKVSTPPSLPLVNWLKNSLKLEFENKFSNKKGIF